MRVKIKGDVEVELNIGDTVKLQTNLRVDDVIVIGISLDKSRFAYISRQGHYLKDWEAIRGGYSIPSKWDGETRFYTNSFFRIIEVMPSVAGETKQSSVVDNSQERQAAWGKEVHQAPLNSPWEFL